MKESTEEEMTGTTIMAVKYCGGIIIGADSRTSIGSYVASRLTDKLTKLSDKIYCCRSGSAADTQAIARIVTSYLKNYESIDDEPQSVKKAATLAKGLIYDYPSLLAGLIVAGWDQQEKGSIYKISLGGSIIKKDWAIGGSGSAFIFAFCDKSYKPGMSKEDGLNFVKEAISGAILRDNSSGGCIRMAVINESGVERFFVPGNRIVGSI